MSQRYLAVWMDHTSAQLIKLTVDPVASIHVTSLYIPAHLGNTLTKNEKINEARIVHLQWAFYKKLSDVMLGYDEVLLFGPSAAKSQVLNNLKLDHRFENIKIQVKNATNLTAQEQHAFIRSHFRSKSFHITYYKIKTNETCNNPREFRTWRPTTKSELYN